MCYNCGCGVPNDNMGDPDNITESTLQGIADKKNTELTKVKEDLYSKLTTDSTKLGDEYEKMFKTAATSWGQSIEEAKKEATSLLKKQLHK